MTIYFKTSALILVSLVIYLILTKQNRDVSTMFSIAVCCVITLVALAYLEPIISFLKDLRAVGDLDTAFTDVLFQALGIGILSELIEMICIDAGNSALAKSFHFLSVILIIWISLPIFNGVFELIEDVLRAI